jgi:hypothetical protein
MSKTREKVRVYYHPFGLASSGIEMEMESEPLTHTHDEVIKKAFSIKLPSIAKENISLLFSLAHKCMISRTRNFFCPLSRIKNPFRRLLMFALAESGVGRIYVSQESNSVGG